MNWSSLSSLFGSGSFAGFAAGAGTKDGFHSPALALSFDGGLFIFPSWTCLGGLTARLVFSGLWPLALMVAVALGLLGLEAAHGLSLRGMKVTVIHLMPTLMERQLDEAAGWLLKNALEARGQTILTGADTAEIVGDGKVEGVKLKDGTLIPASLVVMAVGIRPSVALARDAVRRARRARRRRDRPRRARRLRGPDGPRSRRRPSCRPATA